MWTRENKPSCKNQSNTAFIVYLCYCHFATKLPPMKNENLVGEEKALSPIPDSGLDSSVELDFYVQFRYVEKYCELTD